MNPAFLNSNSTSHTRPFSAVAELVGKWRLWALLRASVGACALRRTPWGVLEDDGKWFGWGNFAFRDLPVFGVARLSWKAEALF